MKYIQVSIENWYLMQKILLYKIVFMFNYLSVVQSILYF